MDSEIDIASWTTELYQASIFVPIYHAFCLKYIQESVTDFVLPIPVLCEFHQPCITSMCRNIRLYCNVFTPKWPPSWIINLKTSGRRFQVCYAQKRCADRGTAPLRTGLSWEINRLSRIRRSHSEVPDDRILKSEAETGCLCTCLWASGWDGAFLSSQRRDVSACLANIQCATALTRELIHNMWSHSLSSLSILLRAHLILFFKTAKHIIRWSVDYT
jgi:hypothetical protein